MLVCMHRTPFYGAQIPIGRGKDVLKEYGMHTIIEGGGGIYDEVSMDVGAGDGVWLRHGGGGMTIMYGLRPGIMLTATPFGLRPGEEGPGWLATARLAYPEGPGCSLPLAMKERGRVILFNSLAKRGLLVLDIEHFYGNKWLQY